MSKQSITYHIINQIHDFYIPYKLIHEFSQQHHLDQYNFGIKRLKNIIFEYIKLDGNKRKLFLNYVHDLKKKYNISRWRIYQNYKIKHPRDNSSEKFFKSKYGIRNYKNYYILNAQKCKRDLSFFINKYGARLGWSKYYRFCRLVSQTNVKRFKHKSIIDSDTSKIKNKTKNQQQYYNEVWKITKQQNLKSLKFYKLSKKHLFSLDHKISINYGFTHNIPPKIIGSIENLQYIPIKLNSSKNKKCFSYIKYSNKNFDLGSIYFKELENLQKAA